MDFLVVAGPHDRLASELVELAGEHGIVAKQVDVATAARIFTVEFDGEHARTYPEVPMLVRVPPPPVLRSSFEESFAHVECLAALWAAAALSGAPVLNRPGPNGMAGRWSFSGHLNERRAAKFAPQQEVFADELPSPPHSAEPGKAWYVQDALTFQTWRWPEVPGNGPYRARWGPEKPAYEFVVVLQGDAWRCTLYDLDKLELEINSIDLVRALGLDFGVVSWSIAADLSSAVAVRVDAYPIMDQVQYVWPALGPKLLEVLR
jgi:hypothetical protein